MVDCVGGGKAGGVSFVLPLDEWHLYGSETLACPGSLVPFTLGTDYVVMDRLAPPSRGLFVKGSVVTVVSMARARRADAKGPAALIRAWLPAV